MEMACNTHSVCSIYALLGDKESGLLTLQSHASVLFDKLTVGAEYIYCY